MPSWYVYILKSINRHFVYIGFTESDEGGRSRPLYYLSDEVSFFET